MEDPRISRMYLALAARWLSMARRDLWRSAVMRSGILTVLTLTIGLAALAWVWKDQHRRSAQLKKPSPPLAASSTRPGGQDPLVLERTQIEAATTPEFTKAILLPGRGMNLFQITAYLPQKGQVQLLASPPLENLARQFTDTAGAVSLTAGGTYEAPWAGRLYGSTSADGKMLQTTWEEHALNLPSTGHTGGMAAATGGLLLERASTGSRTTVMPDGGEAQAVFDVGNFDGHWLSRTTITTTVQLNSHAIEMKIVAQNTGDQPEPMGLGWQPRFAILSDSRASVSLRLPSGTKIEVNRRSGMPTGRLRTDSEGEQAFKSRNGAPLGTADLDDTFVHLHQDMLDDGPIAELRDKENNFGLRITMLSPTIKALHVYAPSEKSFISIAPRFNYDDPFGREWSTPEDAGMATLAPGQSVEWHLRLEIFSLTPAPQRP